MGDDSGPVVGFIVEIFEGEGGGGGDIEDEGDNEEEEGEGGGEGLAEDGVEDDEQVEEG